MSEERTLGQLVAEATQEMSEILRQELELARAELGAGARNGLVAAGATGAAGYLAMLSSVMLCAAAGFGLVAAGMHAWAAFLVVAGALLLVSALLLLVAGWRARRIRAPQRAGAALRATVAALSPGGRAR
jgi:hypothetical protein